MSDYQETEPTTPFGIALNELIKRFRSEGTSHEEIASVLEEAALQAGDEERARTASGNRKAPLRGASTTTAPIASQMMADRAKPQRRARPLNA